ncbi:MAG TPA: SRPBCC domain-containing protein [Solirubrobacter sp.]
MEYGTIAKQIYIDASPEVVYDVITSPEHIARWWGVEADLDPAPGATGALTWNRKADTPPTGVNVTVVDAAPSERFSFRWVHPDGEAATASNSMLVTFVLTPQGAGTLLSLTEEGMREQGWEAAVLEAYYQGHDEGWTEHLADLATYAPTLVRR